MPAKIIKVGGIYLEWVKNRWVIAALICIFIIAAAIIIIVLLCQPHNGSYTNAWYVKLGSCQNPYCFLGYLYKPARAGLTEERGSYII